jgi:hypothetical protein
MRKILNWVWENILFLETVFLLAFIPLFPKIPVLDVKNTWVYIRAEDFVVLLVFLSWLALLVKKKITLKTPLTLPILVFWLIGTVATIHGVLLIFPSLTGVHPNVAFLSLVRHIEYMSLFFIAFHATKDKRMLNVVIATLVITLLCVVAYGFGQKYLGFPAYLTMNEEFAKGIPIRLSQLSRVPSTFAGHYDLAAYLVLIIPILVSLFFGVRNYAVKGILVLSSLLGFVLLFMTVSRVSFFVLFAALLVVLFFQKRKLLYISAVPALILLAVGFMTLQSSLFDRFKSTVSEVDVIVDANSGDPIGHVKFIEKPFFRDKLVLSREATNKEELGRAISGNYGGQPIYATSPAILRYRFIPREAAFVTEENISTGESLTQGSSYVNLYLSPVTRRVNVFFFELPPERNFIASSSAQIIALHGNFIIKKASAYDLSFTTRFQGEWPRAIDAFKNNLLVGSGYGSVSLAVDNNYLRILGEIGVLGFISFLVIFLSLGIYIRKIYKDIDSPVVKSFIIGFGAGVIGLALNATLIDVFEASKIAFLLWMLSGITFGILVLHQKTEINLFQELKKVAVSIPAIISYLLIISLILFSPSLNAYFVGDDFTWLRWAAEGSHGGISSLVKYFTDSDGFFFRPGTKVYFHLMYELFWLNQVAYHMVSLAVHFGIVILFFLLSRRILKSDFLAASSAFLFIVMSGSTEAIFWIASTGHLFNAFFGLLGLLLFIWWDEKRKPYLYIASFVSFALSLLFHELGVVLPLLVVAYKLRNFSLDQTKEFLKRYDFLLLFIPVLIYLIMRFFAQSHWLSGDYNYDLLNLPFNFVGNIIGYVSLVFLGPITLPLYAFLRDFSRENLWVVVFAIPIFIAGYFLGRRLLRTLNSTERGIFAFGVAFFLISLLPFIGLGNITSRYSYLASLGVILIFVVLVKKFYFYMRTSGRETAVAVVSVAIVLFSLFHIIQVQQSYFSWQEAGTRAKNFFISVESLYKNSWSRDDVAFHFVNVPLKVGDAWVFPVGLEDAVWFAFQNDSAKIYKHQTLEEALAKAGLSLNEHVLVFSEDGRVEEINRFKNLIMPQQ